MLGLAGVAYNGSEVEQSTKSGHVTYDIERYVDPYCAAYDPQTGACIAWGGGYWTSAGSGSTNALITATGVASSSQVFANGKPIATVGDKVSETWVANPDIPSGSSSIRYVNIRPAKSGSGQGSVTSGSSKVYVSGKQVAEIGSEVTTHLGNKSKISSGSNNVFIK